MKNLLLTITVIFFCNIAFSQIDEKGVLLGLERSTADAFTKHNIVYLTAILADNATIISATGDVITKAQLLQSVQNVNSVVVSDMQVRVEGNTAIITGIETETGKDNNGNAYSNKMRFTDVFLKTKGNWQIIASQATAIQ